MVELLIVGAGGLARETASAVAAVNAAVPGTFDLLGYLDDDPARHGTVFEGARVLGPVSVAADHPGAGVVVCTGSPVDYSSRRRLCERLDLPADRYRTVSHPTAALGASCSVGPGSILLANVVATASVRIGAHVAVMPGACFTHDDVIGPYATFGAGARLAGGVTVGEGAYVGAGALVREGCRIGAWALVGMGSVVLRDVPPYEVWAGAPARFLRPAPVPPFPAAP